MRSPRILLGLVALFAGACTQLQFHFGRTAFTDTQALEMACHNLARLNEWMAFAYSQGWRVAAGGSEVRSFLGLSTTRVLVCLERPRVSSMAAPPPLTAAPPAAAATDLRSREVPWNEPPTRERSRDELDQLVGPRRQMLRACRANYAREVTSFGAELIVEPSGAVILVRLDRIQQGSSFATCATRVLQQARTAPFAGPTRTLRGTIDLGP